MFLSDLHILNSLHTLITHITTLTLLFSKHYTNKYDTKENK